MDDDEVNTSNENYNEGASGAVHGIRHFSCVTYTLLHQSFVSYVWKGKYDYAPANDDRISRYDALKMWNK